MLDKPSSFLAKFATLIGQPVWSMGLVRWTASLEAPVCTIPWTETHFGRLPDDSTWHSMQSNVVAIAVKAVHPLFAPVAVAASTVPMRPSPQGNSSKSRCATPVSAISNRTLSVTAFTKISLINTARPLAKFKCWARLTTTVILQTKVVLIHPLVWQRTAACCLQTTLFSTKRFCRGSYYRQHQPYIIWSTQGQAERVANSNVQFGCDISKGVSCG